MHPQEGLDASESRQILDEHRQRLNQFVVQWSEEQAMLLRSLALHSVLTPSAHDSERDGDGKCQLFESQGMSIVTSNQAEEVSPVGVQLMFEDIQRQESPGNVSAAMLSSSRQTSPVPSPVSEEAEVRGISFQRKEKLAMSLWESGGSIGTWQYIAHKIDTTVTNAVVLAHVFVMALQANYSVQNIGQSDPLLSSLELPLTIYYAVEIALKLLFLRRRFFFNRDSGWNVFDLGLTCQAVVDLLMSKIGSGYSLNLSFLRVLRIFKVLRLLRLVQLLREFKELRLIVVGMVGSAKALIWSILLVALVQFIFSIVILQICAQHLYEDGTQVETMGGINKYWSSVQRSMLTLFMAISGGEEWVVVVEPLRGVGWHAYAVFLAYLCVCSYGCLNVMNAIFIEAMMTYGDNDREHLLKMELRRKEEHCDRLQALFNSMDDNHNGVLGREEFERYLGTEQMQAFLACLDIVETDAGHFFDLISQSGRVPVDVEAFVNGCMRLKGTARSKDLYELSYQSRISARSHHHILREIKERLAKLDEAVNSPRHTYQSALLGSLSASSTAAPPWAVQISKQVSLLQQSVAQCAPEEKRVLQSFSL